MKKFLSKKFLFFAAIVSVVFIYLVLLEPIARFLIVPDTLKPSRRNLLDSGGCFSTAF